MADQHLHQQRQDTIQRNQQLRLETARQAAAQRAQLADFYRRQHTTSTGSTS